MTDEVHFRVSEEDYIFLQQIKQICFEKYSSYYKSWGKEICALARLGLKHTTSSTHTHKLPPRTENNYQKLLFSMQGYNKIDREQLEDLIDFNCGRGSKDERTFKRYSINLSNNNIISLDQTIPFHKGKEIYVVNQKKILFKLRKLSGTIEDYTIKSTTKTRQPIKIEAERPQTQKRGHKAEIDKILAEVGAVVQ